MTFSNEMKEKILSDLDQAPIVESGNENSGSDNVFYVVEEFSFESEDGEVVFKQGDELHLESSQEGMVLINNVTQDGEPTEENTYKITDKDTLRSFINEGVVLPSEMVGKAVIQEMSSDDLANALVDGDLNTDDALTLLSQFGEARTVATKRKKWVVRAGKKVKVAIRKIMGGASKVKAAVRAKMSRAMKKAGRKASTIMKRLRSMKKRAAMGLGPKKKAKKDSIVLVNASKYLENQPQMVLNTLNEYLAKRGISYESTALTEANNSTFVSVKCRDAKKSTVQETARALKDCFEAAPQEIEALSERVISLEV